MRNVYGAIFGYMALCLSGPAFAETDSVVQQALTLYSAGKPADAYALLYKQLRARAGDPDFDYALGLAAANSGHHGVAIMALQRVIAVQPKNAQARAEIARVYALTGDIDTARAEFSTVVNDPTIPDPVRQRFNSLVRGFDKQIAGGGTSITGFAEVEGGYDNNINSATNLTSITLPVFASFGPATLGGSATKIGEGFVQGQAGLSAQFGLSRQTKLYLSGLGMYRDAFRSKDFDQGALTGTLGISHALANHDVISLSGQIQNFWLGGTSYRASYAAIAQYTHRLSGGRAISVRANYSYLNYARDNLRDADRFSLTATYFGPTTYASVGGGREKTRNAGGIHLAHYFVQASAGIEHPLSPRLALTGAAGIDHRRYDGSDPLFLARRSDTQIDAAIGLRYMLTKAISLRPRATYTRNFSNLALYDYSRATASVALRAEF